MKSILLIFALSLPTLADAGEVRRLVLGETQTGAIRLRLGRSTVLRFAGPPQKIITGNNNYFNFEFVKNDLSIQPLERVESNLFVYGKKRTYGFVLEFPGGERYDDLVMVLPETPRKKPPPPAKKTIRPRILRASERLELALWPPTPSPLGEGVFILDVELMNLSDKRITTDKIDLPWGRLPLPIGAEKRIIFDRGGIAPRGRGRARVFFQFGR